MKLTSVIYLTRNTEIRLLIADFIEMNERYDFHLILNINKLDPKDKYTSRSKLLWIHYLRYVLDVTTKVNLPLHLSITIVHSSVNYYY